MGKPTQGVNVIIEDSVATSRKAWGVSYDSSSDSKFQYNIVSRIEPEASDPEEIIRGDNGCCYEMVEATGLGRCLIRVRDPDGIPLNYYEKNGIQLGDDFAKISGDIWSAWIALAFFHCPEKGFGKSYGGSYGWSRGLEVSIVLLRHEDDLSRWKAVVPKQSVSGASVDADFAESCDLITGEKYDVFPPVGWVHAGSSHSHNTMGAWFSKTDDDYELGVPGVHIVVGSIDKEDRTYSAKGSIVVREVRKDVDFLDLIEIEEEGTMFHKNVLEMIKEESVTVHNFKGGHSTRSTGKTWDPQGKRWVDNPRTSSEDETRRLPKQDPFSDGLVDDEVLDFKPDELTDDEAYAEYLALTDGDYVWDDGEIKEHSKVINPFAERESIESAMSKMRASDPDRRDLIRKTMLDDDDELMESSDELIWVPGMC